LFNRPDCEECKEAYKAIKKIPPCDTCTPPLLSENIDIVNVYLQCCNQVIIAPMGGVIDIDIKAVDITVKRLNPDNPDAVFIAVLKLARQRIKEGNVDHA